MSDAPREPLEDSLDGLDDATRRRWRAAFTAPIDRPRIAEAPPAERIWRAVHGELDPEETAALAAAMAGDPHLAEEWQLALRARTLLAASDASDASDDARIDSEKIDSAKIDIAKIDVAKIDIAKIDIAKIDIAKIDSAKIDTGPDTVAEVDLVARAATDPSTRRRSRRTRAAIGVASLAALAAGLALWLRRDTEGPVVYRDRPDAAAWGHTPSELEPLREPALEWSAIPGARRYRVHLLTERFEAAYTLDATAPRLELPADARARLGDRFAWQVEALDARGGLLVRSPTFRAAWPR
ncbi:MAG: hypothetical protein R3B09_26680 [Nannocystaceae bacterium]